MAQSSFSVATRDVVTPDLILGPDDEELGDATGLNPCPSCDSYQADAPEGVHDFASARKHPGSKAGDARWNFPHCFKCGYRPGTNTAISQKVMSREFAAFQAWREGQIQNSLSNQPGFTPPADDSEAQDLRDQLTRAKANEAELRARLEGGAS